VLQNVKPNEYYEPQPMGDPDELVIFYRALTGATLTIAKHELAFIQYLKTRKYLKMYEGHNARIQKHVLHEIMKY
jgi:hypothetical protein